jgi:signal transduction histidine kinase
MLGVGLVALIAWRAGVPADDAIDVAAIGAGTALVVCTLGIVVLRVFQRRSFAAQVAVTTLVVLVAVGLGAWIAAEAMFLSAHDLSTLAVILVAAGTVGMIAGLVVGRRIGRASGALIDVARRLGAREQVAVGPPAPVPEELQSLYDALVAAAAELAETRAREQALDQSRRELIAWVSHDLRTPLAAIRAVAEALEDGVADDPETIARYHHVVRVEADRLAGLVDDLFELSRAQAGVLQLELVRVRLGDLVSDALAGAGAVAAAKGVHLEGLLVAASPEVDASPPEMLRALRNVLENAIRYTPSDGTVVVEAGVRDHHGYIEVRDSGGGIPTRDLPRVFDVAFSGDPARSRDSGAGLGLAIARGLVEAHRGDISVRNENGGACFTLRLPLAADDR